MVPLEMRSNQNLPLSAEQKMLLMNSPPSPPKNNQYNRTMATEQWIKNEGLIQLNAIIIWKSNVDNFHIELPSEGAAMNVALDENKNRNPDLQLGQWTDAKS